MNLPEARALPTGHHHLRREHLMLEISRDARPRLVSRRVLTLVGAIVLTGAGLAAAASAGVLPGSSSRPSLTVACYSQAATQHASATVIHPPNMDPVHACQMLWRHKMVNLPPRSRPAKVNGTLPTPPNLVACVLKGKTGEPAPVGVFPGPADTCQTLGLMPFTSTRPNSG